MPWRFVAVQCSKCQICLSLLGELLRKWQCRQNVGRRSRWGCLPPHVAHYMPFDLQNLVMCLDPRHTKHLPSFFSFSLRADTGWSGHFSDLCSAHNIQKFCILWSEMCSAAADVMLGFFNFTSLAEYDLLHVLLANWFSLWLYYLIICKVLSQLRTSFCTNQYIWHIPLIISSGIIWSNIGHNIAP